MAFNRQHAVELLKNFGFASDASPLEYRSLARGKHLVYAYAPVAQYGFMTDVSHAPYVNVSAVVWDGPTHKFPVGTLYQFDNVEAIESHMAATVSALQHINERHLRCQACGGWLKSVPAARNTSNHFSCVRPRGATITPRGRLTCPTPSQRDLPVLVRYGSNTIVRPYTELAPAEKRALMRKVWLALLQALTNPEQDVARADYPAWNPVPEDCHLNARRWLAAYPGFELTRGWLHQPSAHGQGSFIPHTVVRDRNGMLRDVTRLAQAVPLRFIPHPTDDVEFDQLVHAAPHCVTELAIGNDEQP